MRVKVAYRVCGSPHRHNLHHALVGNDCQAYVGVLLYTKAEIINCQFSITKSRIIEGGLSYLWY